MKLKQIIDPLLVLLEDAKSAEELLDKHDSQFARRAYIRSIFACIEGTIWLLKQSCVHAIRESGKCKIKMADFAILTEQGFELKQNGEVKSQTRFLKLADNFRFTVRILNSLFRAELDLEPGSTNWANFLRSIEIRHRVTHPKDSASFAISDNEIQLCRDVCSWHNELIAKFVSSLTKNASSN